MPYGTRPGGRVSTMATMPMYGKAATDPIPAKGWNLGGDYDLQLKYELKDNIKSPGG